MQMPKISYKVIANTQPRELQLEDVLSKINRVNVIPGKGTVASTTCHLNNKGNLSTNDDEQTHHIKLNCKFIEQEWVITQVLYPDTMPNAFLEIFKKQNQNITFTPTGSS